jgi:hypothetical protein
MQPWIRTTDKQIEDLQATIARLETLLNGGKSVDYEQNFGISETFTFIEEDNGQVIPYSSGMTFTGDVKASTVLDVGGSLTVGAPNRFEYDEETGEPINAIPNFEMTASELGTNPVTNEEYYSSGMLHMNDTSLNMNVNGVINGDGLSMVLSNNAQAARENIEIITVSGDGSIASYEIENNDANVAAYVPGRYVSVTGIDPAGYNAPDSIILEVDSTGTNLVFTMANETTDTYVAGGYVTISEADSIYEGKLSVRGPGPDFLGATLNQAGVFIGADGGNPLTADTYITPGVVSAPEVAASYLNVDGTKVYVTSVEPSAPEDGDLWIDPNGSPLGGVAAPHAATHGVSGSDPVTLAQSQVVNLTTDLAGKAALVHTHAISDVTGLQTALDAKVDESYEQVTTGWLTAATGWGSVSGIYTEKNGIVQVSLRATRTGASISAGNITNTTVMTIASGYRPLVESAAVSGPSGPLASAYIATTGGVAISALGTTLSTGDNLDINATYIKA